MQLKDYYTTLDVGPAATPLQIKKSFRQLALKHHPDKNPGNALAEAKFREVQEAYDVLSDSGKREEYNYKRWYNRSLKKAFSKEPVTAKEILAECERLGNYLLTVNNLRVDYDGLSYHIRQLLNNKNIAILQQSADTFIILLKVKFWLSVNGTDSEESKPSISIFFNDAFISFLLLINKVAFRVSPCTTLC